MGEFDDGFEDDYVPGSSPSEDDSESDSSDSSDSSEGIEPDLAGRFFAFPDAFPNVQGWVPLETTVSQSIPSHIRELTFGASPVQIANMFGGTHFSGQAPLQFAVPTAGLQAETVLALKAPAGTAPIEERFQYFVDTLIERGVYPNEAVNEASIHFQTERFIVAVEKLIALGVSADVAAKQAARLMRSEKETVSVVTASSLTPKNKYGY